MSVTAVVVAAGRAERFGSLKQFLTLGNETVVRHSVARARSVADRVVVVVPADYDGDGEGADVICIGGATRSASVRSGLSQIGDADIVVIHDAARPFASPALFSRVVSAVESGADAAIPGIAVVDTLKRVASSLPSFSLGTVERDELVAVQTPQAFRTATLVAAHAHDAEATDDAALVERVGGRVTIVEGEVSNRKITTRDDYEWAIWFEGSRS